MLGIVAAFLGLVLVVASLAKAGNRQQFAAAVRSWGVRSGLLFRALFIGMPLAEFAVGAVAIFSTVTGIGQRTTGVAMLLLFSAFVVGQLVVVTRARGATCGCFGRPQLIGRGTVVRSALFAGLASLVILPLSLPFD